jgi:uncharacterized protein
MTSELAFFSADGQIGRGMKGPAEFETGADLLAFMDRLGISRALAWSVEARDGPPMKGNRRLLAEIDSLGARGKRLVASFVVGPSMLREAKAVDELAEALGTGQVKALRVMCRSLSHKMRHVEPLIRQVAQHRPVVFVDIRELSDDGDLLAFAEALPQTPIVCMHAMWPQFFGVFNLLDLLRRRPNILVGTAWMHMRGIIESVAKEFGPDRLVFSAGPPAHNAAAQGALLRADISQDVREAVAHRNLDGLLGLPPTPPLAAPRINSLWETFRQGRPLSVDIIDAHGHLTPPETPPCSAAGAEGDLDKAVRDMDRLGIRTLIAAGGQALHGDAVEGNRLFEKAGAAYGDRIHGYVGFNPYYEKALTPLLDDFFSRPFFVGFKFLCYYWGVAVTDRRFRPAYEYAQRHRLPILLHTWDDPFDTPALLKDIAKDYPDAAFLLGHSGGGTPGRLEAHELAAQRPNVYLEFCGSFCTPIPWEETLKLVEASRVIFGTDAMGHDMAWELARLLSLNVPEETLVPILGANMRRVLARADVPGAAALRSPGK